MSWWLHSILVQGENIAETNAFKYLGIILNAQASFDTEVNHRIFNPNKLYVVTATFKKKLLKSHFFITKKEPYI